MAFYGKGGIGKSTVVCNVAAALAGMQRRVLQIGCDPKADSSRPFWSESRPETVIQLLARHGGRTPPEAAYLRTSDRGVDYIEVGGPEPGVGCAGRGILKMFEIIDESGLLGRGYDATLYDVLGDVVCGGFAAPLRSGHAHEVYVVLSGEYMAVYAANNICRGIASYAARREVRLGGFVLNCRDAPHESAIAEAFAERIGSRVVATVPRSRAVARAERLRKTVVDAFPDTAQAERYRELASLLLANRELAIPRPLSDEELERLFFSFDIDDEAE
jgi:nitrogenase iron protein NifH